MVYKFRLLSEEVKDFVRDIEIRSDQTFYDFHLIIQDDLGFDNSQIASFFLTNTKWEKIKEFTLFDMSDGKNNTLIPMDKAILKNFIENAKQRLIYVFDFFNERSFYIELVDMQKEVIYSDYPAVIFSKGNPPQQILFGGTTSNLITDFDTQSMDFSEDFSAVSADFPESEESEVPEEGEPGEFIGEDDDVASEE